MAQFDLRIYVAHAVFWLAFAAGDLVARHVTARRTATPALAAATGGETLRAPRATLLVVVHLVAFALMYGGVEHAVFRGGMPVGRPLARIVGALLILAGSALICWARVSFASWRFRAQLDAGHQLATGGPFRVIRHPIYAGLDFLALGTALWISTPVVWLGAAAMAAAGDLRARAEEPLLERAFGEAFREYRRRTRRFVPGLY